MPTFREDLHLGHEVTLVNTDDIRNKAVTTEKLDDEAVTTAKLADGAVTTEKILDDAVTTAKIGDGEVKTRNIGTGAVTTDKILDDAVVTAKIQDKAVTTSKIADENIVTGKIGDEAVTTPKIANGAVTTAKISDDAVTTNKIADRAITTPKILDGAITEDKIADSAITNSKVQNGTLSGTKFQDASISGTKILDNSVPGSKLQDGTIEGVDIKDGTLSGAKLVNNSVDGEKLADNAIESRHLIDNSIPASKIKDGTIESVDIKDGTLDGTKIKDNTIESGKLADSAVSEAKIANGAVTTSKINDGAVTTAKLDSESVIEAKIANSNVTTAKIADDAITTDKIANANITTAKINDSAVTTAKIADGAVTSVKIADANITTAKIADEAVTEDALAPGAVTTAKLADGVISEIENITDAVPTKDSVKPMQSGGVLTHGSALDISELCATENPHTLATYADLPAALAALAALPSTYRKGGMSIKFVCSSDNKYVQYRYMSSSTAVADFTNVANWQGVDNEPTDGSDNLVKSGGVKNYIDNHVSVSQNTNTEQIDITVGNITISALSTKNLDARIITLVGLFDNSSTYNANWKVGDVFFNINTGLLRRAGTVDEGIGHDFTTVDYPINGIYSCYGMLWKWTGTRMVPIPQIIPLTSITNTLPLDHYGQFYYSSNNSKVYVSCVSGTNINTFYEITNPEQHIYVFQNQFYIYRNGGLVEFSMDGVPNIQLCFIGDGSTPYVPNWNVGDVMFNISTKLCRRAKTVVSGAVTEFETVPFDKNTVFCYRDLLYKYNFTTNRMRIISTVIKLDSITNSSPLTQLGQLYYSSTNKKIRILISLEGTTYEVEVSENTLFKYNNNLYVIDSNNDLVLVGGDAGNGIFVSSEQALPGTTTIPLSTITTSSGYIIKAGDLIIANQTYSYLYRVTSVSGSNAIVSYITTLKGTTGATGATGAQGNSGYTGAEGELQVVNNCEDGGATAALSAEQGKLLSRWQNLNSETLLLKPKNPRSVAKIPFSAWLAQNEKATVNQGTTTLFDEILQEYVEVKECISQNNSGIMNGGVFVASIGSAIDMTTNVLRGAVYQDENFNVENLGNMNLSLYSDNTIDNEHRTYINLNNAYNGNRAYIRTGWFHFCVNIYVQGTRGNSFDPTNVTHIGFNVNHTTETTLNLAVAELDIVPCLQKPGIVTIVDNFNPNVPEMAEYAASKGVRLNLSIVPNWVGNDSIHGTLQQIYDCAKQGHFIFNHTWNHQIYGGQTPLEVFEQVYKADKWMVERGLSRGAKVLSNPSAAFDLDKYKGYFGSEIAMLYHNWTPYVNPSQSGQIPTCTLYYPYKGMDKLLNMSAHDSAYSADYTQIPSIGVLGANAAITYGGIFVFGFHGIKYGSEGYIPDMAIWKDYIDAISALDIHHYTIDELLEGSFI